jgi:hypothetical protein
LLGSNSGYPRKIATASSLSAVAITHRNLAYISLCVKLERTRNPCLKRRHPNRERVEDGSLAPTVFGKEQGEVWLQSERKMLKAAKLF